MNILAKKRKLNDFLEKKELVSDNDNDDSDSTHMNDSISQKKQYNPIMKEQIKNIFSRENKDNLYLDAVQRYYENLRRSVGAKYTIKNKEEIDSNEKKVREKGYKRVKDGEDFDAVDDDDDDNDDEINNNNNCENHRDNDDSKGVVKKSIDFIRRLLIKIDSIFSFKFEK